MNEKQILETIANMMDRIACLQLALAGLTALVASRLPELSQEEKDGLQKGATQQNDANGLQSLVNSLRNQIERM
jgi:hypothetical protein